MILKGSPQTGFLIKIKANVTKKKKKSLPSKASWLGTEANVHGAPEKIAHVRRQKGHQVRLSSPQGPPATMPGLDQGASFCRQTSDGLQ